MSATPDLEKQATSVPGTASLWRNRDFQLLLSGQAVSRIGTQVSQFAFPLLVLITTKSAAWAGVASSLVAIPYFFLCLFAYVFVEARSAELHEAAMQKVTPTRSMRNI